MYCLQSRIPNLLKKNMNCSFWITQVMNSCWMSGLLRDDQCSRKIGYICQKFRDQEESTAAPPELSTTPVVPSGECPHGFTGLGKCAM